jgi:hypothetical protein
MKTHDTSNKPKTPEQIIREANALARRFYAALGYCVQDGYKFHEATHPQEVTCWHMAEIAFEQLQYTTLSDVLDELDDR